MLNIADRLPTQVRPWYMAARPRSLPATYAPLLLAGAITLADGKLEVVRFVLALVGALLLQISANFINEYIDYQRGTDAHKVDGMGMVLSRAQLTPGQVLAGAVITIVGGALIGLLLVAVSGLTLLWIGMFGVLVVLLYTVVAYIGLGEIIVGIAMGPLMTFGTYYAVTGLESTNALLAGLPVACTVAAILHANNMRDREADALAHKRTLAVRFGARGAQIEFAALIYGAYMIAAVLVILGYMPWPILVAALTLPGAIGLVQLASSTTDPKVLHRAQGMSAQVHFRFGLALALGYVLWALVLALT